MSNTYSQTALRRLAAAVTVASLVLVASGSPALAADPAASASAAAGKTLESVAAVSKSDAWAVGSLIEHWNGRSWSVVRGAQTPCAVYLNGVAARSASSAWAVGYCGRTRSHRPIIEHWNGHQWSVQPSPGAAASSVSQLSSVTVTSQSSAWAVGSYKSKGKTIPLIEHWNGRAWRIQASPDPGTHSAELAGVTALSAASAWAVGLVLGASETQSLTLIEHWNGHRWRTQPSVSPGSENFLASVTALSGTQAWAAGLYVFGSDTGTLVESWNGASWHEPSTPGPGLQVGLLGIAAHSASDVWAVGFRASLTHPRTLVQHWNGTKWEVVPSPSPSPHPDALEGVAVLSRAYAWAVGYRGNKTLIERWNGKAWTVQPSPN
jgi:hypothetical protein